MPRDATSARIVLTTVASSEEARSLAHALVERGLAACVNLIPGLTSIYWWKEAVEESSEVLLVIKTAAEKLSALEATIRELHSYEVPELLALQPETGSQPYLDWLFGSVSDR